MAKVSRSRLIKNRLGRRTRSLLIGRDYLPGSLDAGLPPLLPPLLSPLEPPNIRPQNPFFFLSGSAGWTAFCPCPGGCPALWGGSPPAFDTMVGGEGLGSRPKSLWKTFPWSVAV